MIIDFEKVLRLYTRKDIQESIVALAKDREVAVRYGQGGYGKRPDTLLYPSDVLEFIKTGVTSFHVSEERWSNPLEIQTGMQRKELDNIRIGWDCVLDIDSPYIEYSQITANLILEALKFNGIKSAGIKFSGNHGFHIILPFEAFPKQVGGKETRLLFPEGPRRIANYLNYIIEEKLAQKILEKNTLQEISKATKKPLEELASKKNGIQPFKLVDIDTLLISSRHLFRSIYSINEKSGLVSIPLQHSSLKNFKLKQAKIENIKTGMPFLQKPEEGEANRLLIQAFDMEMKKESLSPIIPTTSFLGKNYFTQKNPKKTPFTAFEFDNAMVKEEFYPSCIKNILSGIKTDGRKRALFVLINFFKTLKMSKEQLLEIIKEWNKKNYEPLREGYFIAQIKWHERQKESVLPPNCNNESYYKSLGIKCPPNLCNFCKNPVNFTLRKIKEEKEKSSKKKTRKTTKKIQKRTSKKVTRAISPLKKTNSQHP
tara:strand:- start:311 stop:1762 length:1452 start_codon:yes stop_codon:yes gene_type:complete